jgi:hypothetical protein
MGNLEKTGGNIIEQRSWKHFSASFFREKRSPGKMVGLPT